MQDYHKLKVWEKSKHWRSMSIGLPEPALYEALCARTTEVRRMLGGLIKKVSVKLESGASPGPGTGRLTTDH